MSQPSFQVGGEATLAGTLRVTAGKGFTPSTGDSYKILTAEHLAGRFSNPGNEVIADDGTRFTIRYTESNVILVVN